MEPQSRVGAPRPPPVGVVDMGESEGAYFLRVALPGINKDQCQIKCEIERDGRIQIEGMMNEPFTVSFRLPGQVDPRLFSSTFGSDGVLEVVVMKPIRGPSPQELS